MYVCICQGVTDTQIKQAIAQGADSMKALNRELGVSIQCGKCGKATKQILRQSLKSNASPVQIWRPNLDANGAWSPA